MNDHTVTFLNAMLDDCLHRRKPLCAVVTEVMLAKNTELLAAVTAMVAERDKYRARVAIMDHSLGIQAKEYGQQLLVLDATRAERDALECARNNLLCEKQQVEDERDALKAALAAQAEPVATITECEACFTPDACQLRGKCDHYSAQQLRVAAQPQQATGEAAVLAKVQRDPVAWTLQSVLDAKKTTNLAPLWFSNPRNTAWTPLYTITQPAPLHNEGPEEKP